jgi:Transport and Golgi organisation 2
MCTVTYLPASHGGFTLTHNRDEAPSRSLYTIEEAATTRGTLYFPRDAKAGGTWIATAPGGKTACLLNGAFVRHHHQPPYRRSRGLMLLDFFDFPDPADFFWQYPLEGMEPFTFLFFQPKKVVEFRWDESRKHYRDLPADTPHFWCSATLYPAEMQVRREQVFRTWLTQQPAGKTPDPRAVLKLHHTGSVGDPSNDYVMQRDGRVQTVSITQVVYRKKITRMFYEDLLEGNSDERLVSAKNG